MKIPSPWRRLERRTPPAERHEVNTRDGSTLALWRVRPQGASRGAVLLLHGLGANRFAFHWPGRSMAQYLGSMGFDCYVGELRGAGASVARRPDWTLHDYLEFDVPALLETIRRVSGEAQVHFVGHSLGGILLLCHAILSGGSGLASGVALGSALDYRAGGSGFAPFLKARLALERLEQVPWGSAMRFLAPVLGRVPDPLSGFNFHPGHAEGRLVREVYANVFGPIPTALLASLASVFEPGGLKAQDGTPFLPRAGEIRTPLLLVAASDDQQCPLSSLEETARASGAHVLRYGTRFGHRAQYGHFDLLLGGNAPEEVWPALARWLAVPGEGFASSPHPAAMPWPSRSASP